MEKISNKKSFEIFKNLKNMQNISIDKRDDLVANIIGIITGVGIAVGNALYLQKLSIKENPQIFYNEMSKVLQSFNEKYDTNFMVETSKITENADCIGTLMDIKSQIVNFLHTKYTIINNQLIVSPGQEQIIIDGNELINQLDNSAYLEVLKAYNNIYFDTYGYQCAAGALLAIVAYLGISMSPYLISKYKLLKLEKQEKDLVK